MNFKLNQLIPLIFQILLHIGQMFHVMPNLLIIGKNDTLSDKKGNLTVLKLHELCYYVQCWYIVLNDELIFKDNFQALIHGPTSKKLFKALQPTYTSLYDIIPNTL